jgi:hypothetical protein
MMKKQHHFPQHVCGLAWQNFVELYFSYICLNVSLLTITAIIDNMLLSDISVDLIFSDHTHQVKMNMLGEPSFQGSGQSQHESEMGSNAALTELDKGLSSLHCSTIEQS